MNVEGRVFHKQQRASSQRQSDPAGAPAMRVVRADKSARPREGPCLSRPHILADKVTHAGATAQTHRHARRRDSAAIRRSSARGRARTPRTTTRRENIRDFLYREEYFGGGLQRFRGTSLLPPRSNWVGSGCEWHK